jgi:hypothetical protein
MTMNKPNQILAVALVVQIALAAFVLWPKPAASGSSSPLWPNFKAADVTSLTLSSSTGDKVTLAKNGDNWVLPEADDFPADATKVTPLLEKIEKVKTNRLVTQTEGSQARLKVAANDFNNLVEVKLKDGSSHKLYLGSSAGASATHVRADDHPEVYLTGELSSYDASPLPSTWINPLYFTVPQTATTGLTLENANGTFEFEKEGEKWTMQGLTADETFNENNFTSLFSQATGINMLKPVGKTEDASFGLDKPQAVVTLKTADKTYTLSVGAKDDKDNTYVVKSSESPYYVRVNEGIVQNFIEKKRDDFLQAPPTAEPTAEATPAP